MQDSMADKAQQSAADAAALQASLLQQREAAGQEAIQLQERLTAREAHAAHLQADLAASQARTAQLEARVLELDAQGAQHAARLQEHAAQLEARKAELEAALAARQQVAPLSHCL